MSRQPPAPFFYLRPDETVVSRERPSVGYALHIFARAVVVLSVLAALAGAVMAVLPDPPFRPAWVPRAYVALIVTAALVAWRRWATTEYAITDARIYARRGRLFTTVHFTTHDKVTDLRLRQGPLERLFGIGRLSLATAGGDIRMVGLRDTVAVKERAEVTRDAFVRALLEQAGVVPEELAAAEGVGAAHRVAHAEADEEAAAEPAAAPPPPIEWEGPPPDYIKASDRPVWRAKPRPIAAVGALKSLVGILPILLLQGYFSEPLRAAVPGLVSLIIVVAVVLRVTQLRRMEYVATDRRVYARSGVVGTTVSQLTYDKITDITYRQDVLGRMLGYGAVVVSTAGGGAAPITMEGLGDPLGAKEVVERWRDSYLREGPR